MLTHVHGWVQASDAVFFDSCNKRMATALQEKKKATVWRKKSRSQSGLTPTDASTHHAGSVALVRGVWLLVRCVSVAFPLSRCLSCRRVAPWLVCLSKATG